MYALSHLEESKPNLGSPDVPAGEVTWLFAKSVLNQTAKGRQTVSYTEQNIKTNSMYASTQPI
jgi:hypothetical protein